MLQCVVVSCSVWLCVVVFLRKLSLIQEQDISKYTIEVDVLMMETDKMMIKIYKMMMMMKRVKMPSENVGSSP